MRYAHLKAANELIGALVMGLWNRLTRHQERAFPPREGMAKFARLRQEELEGQFCTDPR